MRMLRFLAAAVAPLLLAIAGEAAAQTAYPERPIRIVMPFAAGGNGDAVARALAPRLGERLRTTVIVENRAGAGGAIGTEAVVRSPPDGYTILLTSSAIAIDPSSRRDLSYDPRRDLVPITQVTDAAFVLMVNPQLPVRSVRELIAYAKAHPGRLNYGTPGTGSSIHLSAEYFRALAGIEVVHVPYRGNGPVLIALAANEIQLALDPVLTSKPVAEAGRARALAVTTGTRVPGWPDLPTIRESGLPEYEISFWLGAFAPAGTPEPIVLRLNEGIRAAVESPEMRRWAEGLGTQVVTQDQPAFRRFFESEVARWAGIVARAGVRVE